MTDRDRILAAAVTSKLQVITPDEFGVPSNAVQIMRNEHVGDDAGLTFSFDEHGALEGFGFTHGVADGA